MPDIFGREAHDYAHLQVLNERGMLDQAQSLWARSAGRPPHNFNALQPRGWDGMWSRDESNAQALGFLTNNLQAVQAGLDEILYTQDRTAEMVPIITNVPEGAATYAYRVIDRAGRGRFIDFDGSMAPSANVGVRLVPYGLEYAGIVPEWTMEDLRRSMFTGVPLDSEVMKAAARGAKDHIEEIAFIGDAKRGFYGLTNLPTTGDSAVNRSNAASTISAMDGDALVVFLQEQVTKIVEDTMEVFGRNIQGDLCIYLPISQATKVTNHRLVDVNMSVWGYFCGNNTWANYTGKKPMLKWLQELKGAGTSNSDRMIIAMKDTRIMEMAIPIYPRVLTTLNYGFYVQAPMEYKISGLNVKRPSSIYYVDRV